MYLKEYFPFYTTYANPLLYEGERMQDKEFNLMKSYYPDIHHKGGFPHNP